MPSLYKAVGVPGTGDTSEKGKLTHSIYQFDDSNTQILWAPEDTDWSRWGMLSDRRYTRLYFFRKGSNHQLYQFIQGPEGFYYDESFGHLSLQDIPEAADPSHIGMLSTPNFEDQKFDGSTLTSFNGKALPMPNNYHVYMLEKPEVQSQSEVRTLHQMIWEKGTQNIESNGITNDKFYIRPFPVDVNVDWTRWSMNYDSNRYQLMLRAYVLSVFKQGSTTELYQARFDNFDESSSAYQFSGTAELVGAPEGLNYQNFASVFDGVKTSFYFLKFD